MYFADMFCYGKSTDKVAGITGILGCMGVIYVGHGWVHAIHIPPETKMEDLNKAREDFAAFVNRQETAGVGEGHGRLFAFVNGANRAESSTMPSGEEEMEWMKKALGRPETTLYRIMRNLGAKSGGSSADSAAIMLKQFHGSWKVRISYKRNEDIKWIEGGDREAGQYKTRAAYQGAKIPENCMALPWTEASGENCTLTTI